MASHLKYEDHQEYLGWTLTHLRNKEDLCDVTLVCENNQQTVAHKVILSASSPFFKNILKGMTYIHSVIYMRGVKIQLLESILDFIYKGEANIEQDDVEPFINLAKELKLQRLESESAVLKLPEDITNEYNSLTSVLDGNTEHANNISDEDSKYHSHPRLPTC